MQFKSFNFVFILDFLSFKLENVISLDVLHLKTSLVPGNTNSAIPQNLDIGKSLAPWRENFLPNTHNMGR